MRCPNCVNSTDNREQDSFDCHGSSKKYTHYTCLNCGAKFGYSDVLGYND